MISLTDMAKNVGKFTTDNSPVVLTAIGVTGVVTTSILAAKGGMKAADILRDEDVTLTTQEKALKTWKCYIPAVSSGALTCTAIVASTQIGNRRAAAMAAAYTLSEKKVNEYRNKVAEVVGEKKAEEIQAEVQKDTIDREYSDDVVIMTSGDQLCYDSMSGRFFMSDMEALKYAMNRVNHQINNDGYASLNDFYDHIGIDRTAMGEEIGWRSDDLLEIHFLSMIAPNNKPAISMEYRTKPVRNYFRQG